MAVERASTSRLNALAVYAFALAIAWLPGHTCVASAIDVAKAQSSPLRFTTAAHMRVPLNSPPASPPCDGAATRSCLSCPAEGTPEQFAALSWACAPAVARPQRRRAGAASNSLVGFITPPALRGTGERRSGARRRRQLEPVDFIRVLAAPSSRAGVTCGPRLTLDRVDGRVKRLARRRTAASSVPGAPAEAVPPEVARG